MIVGREHQQQELLDLLQSDESQFCAVYGRRRVGKTFLCRQTFNNEFAFSHTGLSNATKEEQLSEFRESLRSAGMRQCKLPKTWLDAFHLLEDHLASLPQSKKVVFIDELPWLDTPKSRFITALEHFWNGWASTRRDIVLIVCGSATSWIIDNIINNHGGLHNRLSHQIHLQPFSLHECELYLNAKNILMPRKDIIEAYMILGGIPYYWNYIRRGESLAQNIDRMFFMPDAPLQNEFEALFRSLFKRHEMYVRIVEALTEKRAGLLREQLLQKLGVDDNESFQKALRELKQCGFIRKYNMMDFKSKNALYQLIDNFTLFHFQHIATNQPHDEHYWSNIQFTGRLNAWAGLAFERVCLLHTSQIKQALGIAGVRCNVYSWTSKPTDATSNDGFQIDLLLERDDNIINICEMKYTNDEYVMSAETDRQIRQRISRFAMRSSTRKAIHPVLVTTYGLSQNGYSSVFQRVITMKDLFA